jgi:hypothetical protein
MIMLKLLTLEWIAPYQRISSQTMVTCAYRMMFFHTAGSTYATRPWTWVTAFICNAGKFVWAVIICPTFRPTTAWGTSGITRHSLWAQAHGMTLWWDWTERIGSTWVWQTRICRFQDAAWIWITYVTWFTVTCFLIFSDVTVSITATRPRRTQRLNRFCNMTQHNHIFAHVQVQYCCKRTVENSIIVVQNYVSSPWPKDWLFCLQFFVSSWVPWSKCWEKT